MSTPTNRPRQDDQFEQLIAAIDQNGDRAAFAQLFEHFAPRIKTLMLRLGANPARAEELAQDSMLAVWRKAPLFDPRAGTASGWVYRIARNLLIDAVRRDRRFAAMPRDEEEPVPQPDTVYLSSESGGRVRSALAQLGDDQIHVIKLAFFEEKTHTEIARELNIPLGTVKSRLRLAMRRLRALLDHEQ